MDESRLPEPVRRGARAVRRGIRKLGVDVVRHRPAPEATAGDPSEPPGGWPPDLSEADRALVRRVDPYTLTTVERIIGWRDAVAHVHRAGIPGAIVECGVWRGGSLLVAALALADLDGGTDRELVGFDTFDRMPMPEDRDVDFAGVPAAVMFEGDDPHDNPGYRYLPIDEVRSVLESSGHPSDRIRLVQGLVEDTIPEHAPDRIAALRLDTDWYRSTRHELEHLWPRLAPGGILLVDDYGHFRGSKDAVDEHLAALGTPLLLHRLDFTGRIIVKP